MVTITFKNLETSQLAKDAVHEKMEHVLDQFPELSRSKCFVTLEMENSPRQSGPDVFKTKLRVQGGKFDGLILEKQALSLYIALADLSEHLLERLNRMGDKVRVKARHQARKFIEKTLVGE